MQVAVYRYTGSRCRASVCVDVGSRWDGFLYRRVGGRCGGGCQCGVQKVDVGVGVYVDM